MRHHPPLLLASRRERRHHYPHILATRLRLLNGHVSSCRATSAKAEPARRHSWAHVKLISGRCRFMVRAHLIYEAGPAPKGATHSFAASPEPRRINLIAFCFAGWHASICSYTTTLLLHGTLSLEPTCRTLCCCILPRRHRCREAR